MSITDNLSVQLYTEDELNVNLLTEDSLGVQLTSDLSIISTTNYEELENLPQINSVTLIGNILSSALGIKLSDLVQDENTYTVLNCGTSTTVI